MQTVWFPVPVAAFFRRIVNVVSTLSISQQYLHSPADPDAPRSSLARRRASTPQRLDAYTDLDEAREKDTHHKTSSSWTPDQIHLLMNNPALYHPLRKPRYPIVLCHGLYGFDVRGPSAFPILQQHYWSNVLNVLRKKVGAEVLVTGVPSTGSVSSRAENLDKFLRDKAPARGVNFLAHSMGGLDCRHLITHLKPQDYTPLSLTTIATPHRGSPFMDWCSQYIGLGSYKEDPSKPRPANSESSPEPQAERPSEQKRTSSMKSLLSITSLPSSFTTLLISLLDSPAYGNLTSTYLNTIFNPNTPDDPSVKYFSVAGRTSSMNIWHPLWLPKMVLDGFEERERSRLREQGHPIADMDSQWGNDGLVTVQSARWGEFLGVLEGCDHWELRGARGLDVDLPTIPGTDSWNFADWGKFVRAWKREEKAAARSAGAGISDQGHALATAGASMQEAAQEGEDPRQKRDRVTQSMNADEVVKNSTDKLSAVFDWIVESVPSPLAPGTSSRAGDNHRSESGDSKEKYMKREREKQKATKPAERSDLATKMDLERFYVSLCKKLYDEGL
ncbi:alpha/beta-hydrolase [Polyporus arcularius HHB13444]|uniref:Alpha/beta-hydrolase n=1 Tax=Polyporus arcularius HHB13444 TaxID=1314778 RepID=A0A5C3PWX6_9APHY|nr:alpha/beta-hydrolase [Polyporus arcularius HHB13444]